MFTPQEESELCEDAACKAIELPVLRALSQAACGRPFSWGWRFR